MKYPADFAPMNDQRLSLCWLPTLRIANLGLFSSFILIAGSLSIGVALPLLTGVAGANPVTPAQVAPSTPSDPIGQKLLGQWLMKEPLEGETGLAVFAPEGKLFLISGISASGSGVARQVQYQINSTPKPSHLDIVVDGGVTIQTLFEFTSAGDLRLQVSGIIPGQPRPTALTENATVFQKISDSVTLPAGVELK